MGAIVAAGRATTPPAGASTTLRARALSNGALAGAVRAVGASARALRAYASEAGVAPGSETETYVALKLGVDNWRWAGVPFYLRTGQAMNWSLIHICRLRRIRR